MSQGSEPGHEKQEPVGAPRPGSEFPYRGPLAVSQFPEGTLTFLLTDIEGSTRLWERYPDAMPAALARHDALLAAAIEARRGFVIRSRGEGDSCFAVFPS